MRARKRFGQNFLHDPAVIDRIVASIGPRAGDHLVEIGPGRGALTRRLLEAPWETLDAVEIDRDLAALLREQLAERPGFTLHEGDALDFDFEALARQRGGRLRVIGNLPYNISTPLLFHLLRSAPLIEDLHVMLQREVVNRLVAKPDTDDYGRLTVMLAPWAKIERLFEVGPGAFQPRPQVWSAVARLSFYPEPLFPISPSYGRVVAAAFAHRRKTLRNALRGVAETEHIQSAGIDPGVRPETLPPQAFNAIAQVLDGTSPPTTRPSPFAPDDAMS